MGPKTPKPLTYEKLYLLKFNYKIDLIINNQKNKEKLESNENYSEQFS